MLRDAFAGRGAMQIIERDDGFIEASSCAVYFAQFRRWPEPERRGARFVRGRVLDIGCGAGRVALHLQARGQDVVAIDASEGAVEVSRRRGVHDARVIRFEEIADAAIGTFDTFVMYGNNLALLESADRAPQLLAGLRRIASPRARVVAGTLDPYETAEPTHLAYHARNREAGRMAGQIRIRLRYREIATPWRDILFTSRDETRELAAAGGWRVERFIPEAGALYVAVLTVA